MTLDRGSTGNGRGSGAYPSCASRQPSGLLPHLDVLQLHPHAHVLGAAVHLEGDVAAEAPLVLHRRRLLAVDPGGDLRALRQNAPLAPLPFAVESLGRLQEAEDAAGLVIGVRLGELDLVAALRGVLVVAGEPDGHAAVCALREPELEAQVEVAEGAVAHQPAAALVRPLLADDGAVRRLPGAALQGMPARQAIPVEEASLPARRGRRADGLPHE